MIVVTADGRWIATLQDDCAYLNKTDSFLFFNLLFFNKLETIRI